MTQQDEPRVVLGVQEIKEALEVLNDFTESRKVEVRHQLIQQLRDINQESDVQLQLDRKIQLLQDELQKARRTQRADRQGQAERRLDDLPLTPDARRYLQNALADLAERIRSDAQLELARAQRAVAGKKPRRGRRSMLRI